MSNFQERFKNKSSTIAVTGQLALDPARAILKPSASQLHGTIFQNSGNYIITPGHHDTLHKSKNSLSSPISDMNYPQTLVKPISSVSPKLIIRSQHQSTTPLINKPDYSSIYKKKVINQSYDKRIIDFTPYTLEDYHNIKYKTYYQLGGLGPSSVGTNEWMKKKVINDKRVRYGKKIYFINAGNLPPLPATNIVRPLDSNKELEADIQAEVVNSGTKSKIRNEFLSN